MRDQPTSGTLYDRASESAKETRQGVVTMSSASLGVFFFALTAKVEPALSIVQQRVVLIALGCMAFATFSGLWSAWSDARWSYAWGRELEDHEQDAADWAREKDRWHERKRWGERYSLLAFVVGVSVGRFTSPYASSVNSRATARGSLLPVHRAAGWSLTRRSSRPTPPAAERHRWATYVIDVGGK